MEKIYFNININKKAVKFARMQMLISDGRNKLTQEEIAEKVKKQAAEDEKEA